MERILIIGRGVAGNSAAREILKSRVDFRLTLLSEEEPPLYSKPLLPLLIGGTLPEERLLLRGVEEEFPDDGRLEFLKGERGTRLDPKGREAETSRGRTIPFDLCLIATGGKPELPQCGGRDLPGVFTLRDLGDAKRIMAWGGERAVVAGGGLVGIESAEALGKRGYQVTVVVSSPRIFSRNLDQRGSEIARSLLLSHGIEVMEGKDISLIQGRERVEGVVLKDGSSIEADLVLFGKGVRPSLDLLDADLRSGVRANPFFETVWEGVFCAGDAPLFKNLLTGEESNMAVYPFAALSGSMAGKNIIRRLEGGEMEALGGYIPVNSFRVFGTPFASAGLTHGEGLEDVKSERDGRYINVFLRRGVPAGFVMAGDVANSGVLLELMRRGEPLPGSFPLLSKRLTLQHIRECRGS